MKRLALLISATAIALSFNACEQHTAAELPEHYQHKGGTHSETTPHEKAPTEHAKAEHKAE